MDLYTRNSLKCSKATTTSYSTSFSLGVRMLDNKFRPAIYAIYGFVRFADEIVDTFHEHDKAKLLSNFRAQCYEAIEQGISTNPILHSFQWAVNKYQIDHNLIDAFFKSMEMDLVKKNFSKEEYQEYIYGSAEVVGLMCLKVFCQDKPEHYHTLVPPARKLGEAFQKVNFLRDMLSDQDERGRIYFPDINFSSFDKSIKTLIEKEIERDFDESLPGIRNLNKDVRLGVFLAYRYYLQLLFKIKACSPEELIEKRISVSNKKKIILLFESYFRNQLNWI